MSRCACCQTVLTVGEMMFDLPDGSMNDICWSCQGVIDHPECCEDREYQFENYTEVPFTSTITKAKKIAY